MTAQPPSAPGAYNAIVLVSLLDRIGFSALQPLMPFLVLHFGGSPVLVTQLVAVFFLASFIGSPALGLISDRMGRHIVVSATLIVSLLCYLGILVSWSLVGVFVFRAITGFLDGRSTVLRTLGTDNQPDDTQVKRVSWLMGTGGIGKMIGPAMAGLFALWLIEPEHQYKAILAFVAALTVFTLILFVVKVRPAARTVTAKQAHPQPIKLASSLSHLKLPLALTIIIAFGEAIMLSMMALYVHHRFGWGVVETGWLLTGMAASTVLARLWLLNQLTKRWGAKTSMILTMALTIAALIGMAFSTSPMMFTALSMIFALVLGVASTLPTAMVSVQAQAHARGYALGMNDAVRAVALAIAASTNGLWFEYVAPNAPHLVAGAILAVGIVVLMAGRTRSGA